MQMDSKVLWNLSGGSRIRGRGKANGVCNDAVVILKTTAQLKAALRRADAMAAFEGPCRFEAVDRALGERDCWMRFADAQA